MPIKRKGDWFSQQKNEVIRRISWYWFVQPESPSSISIKLYPHEAYSKHYDSRKEKIKNFTIYRVSTHIRKFKRKGKIVEVSDGYKDITPERYFDVLPAIKNTNNYKLKMRTLNLNFLFDYLESKKIDINPDEKNILKEFLNKSEIRKFLFDWNKHKNEKMSYDRYDADVFDFKENLVDAIVTFLRCIRWYEDEEMLYYVFDKKSAILYFKILPIVQEFLGYGYKKMKVKKKTIWGKISTHEHHDEISIMLGKFDDLSNTIPILLQKEQVIDPNSTDKKEIEILNYIKYRIPAEKSIESSGKKI